VSEGRISMALVCALANGRHSGLFGSSPSPLPCRSPTGVASSRRPRDELSLPRSRRNGGATACADRQVATSVRRGSLLV
jgi:hypothetical protein